MKSAYVVYVIKEQYKFEERYVFCNALWKAIIILYLNISFIMRIFSLLDVIKKQLQKSVAENTTMSNQIVRLESDVMEMTEQLKNNHSELEDVNRKLGKEQAKNRSMEKQGQVRRRR